MASTPDCTVEKGRAYVPVHGLGAKRSTQTSNFEFRQPSRSGAVFETVAALNRLSSSQSPFQTPHGCPSKRTSGFDHCPIRVKSPLALSYDITVRQPVPLFPTKRWP